MNHATVVAAGTANFAHSEALKKSLAAATSVEEINVIGW